MPCNACFLQRPRALLWLIWGSHSLQTFLWMLQQCASSRLTDSRLQYWQVGSRYRGTSLSCRSQLHDMRSKKPGMGIRSIAGSSVMHHGKRGILSSIITLDRWKAPEMGSSSPVKLRLGSCWLCRIGKLCVTGYRLDIYLKWVASDVI